jgi:cystathionine beta-lyase
MTTYNFDTEIDRRGTDAIKFVRLQQMCGSEDILPLWVADMDFATPPFIIDALRRRLDHPVMGYTEMPTQMWPTVCAWIKRVHGWDVCQEWMHFIPGIVRGIGMVINCMLRADEKVLIQPPVYHPFRLVPEGNDRPVVYNPLIELPEGGYRMDLDLLESQIAADPKIRLMVLCNPHNPAGICWDADTLRRVAHICHSHGVIVISDEIHSDMALFGHRHLPFASVSDEAAQCSITFQSPSKTFNIAGIVSSYAIVPNPELRERFYRWVDANEFSDPSLFQPIATIAALTDQGADWRSQMLHYVEANVRFVEDFCREHLPAIRPWRPEASFLVWLDCRALDLSQEQLVDLFIHRAHLLLNDGSMFGTEGTGFMRLNVATPRSVLARALVQLRAAIENP